MKEAKEAKVIQSGFAVNAFYEGLNRRIAAGSLRLSDLSTPTRLSLMAYEAAKREHEAMKR